MQKLSRKQTERSLEAGSWVKEDAYEVREQNLSLVDRVAEGDAESKDDESKNDMERCHPTATQT